MTARIFLVEDDRTLRTTLADALASEGHTVTTAQDGDEALSVLRTRAFDLLVLDVMLPGPSGLEILQAVRKRDKKQPVMLLTARSSEGDKVLGLELGADDYVTKPFSLRELLARVRALLRRADVAVVFEPQGRFSLGGVHVDLDAYEVRLAAGAVQRLSAREAAMLAVLWRERGKVVSRARFLQDAWGGDANVGDRTIDTHVLHLRQKLERDAKTPKHILTVHGVGYRLVLDPDGSEPLS